MLFREARLIDQGKLREWMELFTSDGIYWLPIDENAAPGQHVTLIYDDAQRREERVYRLLDTIAHAQDPTSVTQHFISNVIVRSGAGDEPLVHSSQIIYELRGNGADYRHLTSQATSVAWPLDVSTSSGGTTTVGR